MRKSKEDRLDTIIKASKLFINYCMNEQINIAFFNCTSIKKDINSFEVEFISQNIRFDWENIFNNFIKNVKCEKYIRLLSTTITQMPGAVSIRFTLKFNIPNLKILKRIYIALLLKESI